MASNEEKAVAHNGGWDGLIPPTSDDNARCVRKVQWQMSS
jgi:hypothetical protein